MTDWNIEAMRGLFEAASCKDCAGKPLRTALGGFEMPLMKVPETPGVIIDEWGNATICQYLQATGLCNRQIFAALVGSQPMGNGRTIKGEYAQPD